MAYTRNLIHCGQCTRALIYIMVFLNMVYSHRNEYKSTVWSIICLRRDLKATGFMLQKTAPDINTIMRYLVMYTNLQQTHGHTYDKTGSCWCFFWEETGYIVWLVSNVTFSPVTQSVRITGVSHSLTTTN